MIEQIVAALLDRVNQLELENIRLDARIDALIERVNQLEGENIRLATHIGEADADDAEEEHERQMDEEANRCPRCGGEYKNDPIGMSVGGDLCSECESELAMEHAPFDAFWDYEYDEEPP